jgi:hypothetical protein
MWGDDEKKKFREGFTGQKEGSDKKRKKTDKERIAERLARMTPAERAERQKKIDAQSKGYKDGGMPKKKSYFGKLKKACKK